MKAGKKKKKEKEQTPEKVPRQVDLRKEFRSTARICYIIAGSLLIYPLVVELVKRFVGPEPLVSEGHYPQMREILFAMALVALFTIRFLHNAMLKKNPQENVKVLVRKLRTAHIATAVLCKIPAVLGFVLFFFHGFSREIYAFFAFSLVMMVLYFPKFDHWVVWLRK